MTDDTQAFLKSTLRNRLREKFARDEVVSSMTVRLVRSAEIARIAKTAGFDSVYVDLEHCAFSLDDTSRICMACLDAGVTPLVRVPANTPEYIGRVLDGGALGIIAPHVRSAEEARAVVRAARFQPLGDRSANGALPHLGYRSFPARVANPAMNEATVVVLMLETVEALERVEEIVAVEGVDMLLMGTNDLTADWGIPGQYDDPRVAEAFQRCIDACRRHGRQLGVGGLASRPDLVQRFVQMGARYVSTGTDLNFLLAAATGKAQAVAALST